MLWILRWEKCQIGSWRAPTGPEVRMSREYPRRSGPGSFDQPDMILTPAAMPHRSPEKEILNPIENAARYPDRPHAGDFLPTPG